MAMFCNACGKEIDPGVKFCGSCGAPITPNTAATGDIPGAAGANDSAVNATAGAGSAGSQTAAGDITGAAQSAAASVTPDNATNAQSSGQQTSQQIIDSLMKIAQNTADHSEGMEPADIEKNKVIGCFAYILFFLPLVTVPESKYGRFHANQGLVYLILFVVGAIATTIVRMLLTSITWRLLWLSSLISFLVFLPIIAIGVVGLINGYTGKAKDLPIIGTIRILK